MNLLLLLSSFFLSLSSSKIKATQGVAEGNRRTQEAGKSCGLYFGTGGDWHPETLHPSPALCVLDIALWLELFSLTCDMLVPHEIF